MVSLLAKIKALFTSNNRQQKRRGFPPKFGAKQWSKTARKLGVSGDRNKRIKKVENGEVTRQYPYHKALYRNIREELKTPVWDETGGKQTPIHDELATYMPNVIAYDQRNIHINEQP